MERHLLSTATVCAIMAVVLACVLERRYRRWTAHVRARVPSGGASAKVYTLGDAGAASLVVFARIGALEAPMVIDTGFSGAPLLSLPWLARQKPGTSCERVYLKTLAELDKGPPGSFECVETLDLFVKGSGVSSFTAGCSNVLQGIGGMKTVTSEMLLTPPIELQSEDGSFFVARHIEADVLTTTDAPTCHLLTVDFLRQNSPSLVAPSTGEMSLRLASDKADEFRRSGFLMSSELRGGAFVAEILVGGRTFRVTVDTGSPLTVSLGRRAADQVRMCHAHEAKRLVQRGINGERVCSDIVWAAVKLGASESMQLPVFLNDSDATDADGYVGLGLLRGYDLMFDESKLFAIRSGLAIDADAIYALGTRAWCSSAAPRCAA